jgi:hypothetical protein
VHKPSVSCKKNIEVLIKMAFLLQNIQTITGTNLASWILVVLSQS